MRVNCCFCLSRLKKNPTTYFHIVPAIPMTNNRHQLWIVIMPSIIRYYFYLTGFRIYCFKHCFKAIGEELAGFFLRDVIPPLAEHHYEWRCTCYIYSWLEEYHYATCNRYIVCLGEYHYICMKIDLHACMYYLIRDLMQLHVLYYMHQVAMHHLYLHVLPKPKRVAGASTPYETVRYP